MQLARVTGTVVSTTKAARLRGHRLLTVRALSLDGSEAGAAEDVALDAGLDAGVGDTVLVAKEGAVVADLFDRDLGEGELATPANVVIVAVVDEWSLAASAR